MRSGFLLFWVQFILNLVGTFNIRSTAQASYVWTGITDLLIAVLGFIVIREISMKENRTAKLIGFTIGAITGSLVGIYISKIILNG